MSKCKTTISGNGFRFFILNAILNQLTKNSMISEKDRLYLTGKRLELMRDTCNIVDANIREMENDYKGQMIDFYNIRFNFNQIFGLLRKLLNEKTKEDFEIFEYELITTPCKKDNEESKETKEVPVSLSERMGGKPKPDKKVSTKVNVLTTKNTIAELQNRKCDNGLEVISSLSSIGADAIVFGLNPSYDVGKIITFEGNKAHLVKEGIIAFQIGKITFPVEVLANAYKDNCNGSINSPLIYFEGPNKDAVHSTMNEIIKYAKVKGPCIDDRATNVLTKKCK